MDFHQELNRYVERIGAAIETLLPAASQRPSRLHEAMRYPLEAGGKRIRPVLVLAAASAYDPQGATDPLPAAVAVECVHTYSLVHDDLPCMDDDDLRRGRPTTHRAFDEATALLAGDALLTHAFEILSHGYAPRPILANALVRELAGAAGSRRLIGGQMEDLLAERRRGADARDLEFIHLNKTAAMLEASLVMGGWVGGADPAQIEALRQTGRQLGLAFQIVDDILDATVDTGTLGKTAGKDAAVGKATYVSVHGLDEARRLAAESSRAAVAGFRDLAGASPGARDFMASLAEGLLARRS